MQRALVAIAGTALWPLAATAATVGEGLCEGSGACTTPGTPVNPNGTLEKQIGNISNIILYLAAALAVIVIIFGGVRYITSTGDAGRVKQAKDTITYGVIGLAIAILAYAIVRFVISKLIT